MKVIFETDDKRFRIIEKFDVCADMRDLKGDMFKPEANPDIPVEQLKREEREFEKLVDRLGVYGYVLERWNPEPGIGYEHVDSVWGFIGQYDSNDERFNHYIIDEMKRTIEELAQNKN